MRTVIPDEYLAKTKDMTRLDICMLNDYLNRYTEKLTRGNSFDPNEIRIDQLNFLNVTKCVGKKTFNPYLVFYSQKTAAAKMNKVIMASENPRYMSKQLKA